MKSVRLGTRGSKLAIIQAQELQNQLIQIFPELTITLVKIKTTGDRDRVTSLDVFSNQGVFVKELERALLDRRIDLAIHSLKDLPTEIPQGLSLTAVTSRLDPRDVLASRSGKLEELPRGSKIGTGSRRRSVQLLALRPELNISDIRGNIDTRLRKVFNGEFDGIVVAAAGMIRLGMEEQITEYLPPELFTPAVGQGALGIETRAGDEETASLVSRINHMPTWQAVIAERTFLRALGGGCRTPISALGTISGDALKLTVMVAGNEGVQIIRATDEGAASQPEHIGRRLAQKMTDMGALAIIRQTKS
jgi:hydroxymethylbilane synthase